MTSVSDGSTGGRLAPFGLIRSREDRLFAGVCAALGRASGTDPLLWRAGLGVLVVFAGSGILLYIIGWLFFPAEGDEVSPLGGLFGRGRSSSAVIATVALLAAAVVCGVIVALSPSAYPIVCLGAAMMLLAALAKNRPPPEPAVSREAARSEGVAYRAPFAPQGPFARESGEAPEPVAAAGVVAPRPAVSDEPATAPDAASTALVEDRVQVRRSEKRRSRVLNLVGFGLVGMAMGVMLIIALSGVAIPVMVFEGVALLIVGLVVLVGALWGRARLLVAFGAVLSLAISVHYVVSDGRFAGVVNTSISATGVADIPAVWSVRMADADLDLRDVEFEDDSPVDLQVMVQGGDARIFVPPEVDVHIWVTVTGGDIRLLEDDKVSSTVALQEGAVLSSNGADGPGGGRLQIDAVVEFGYLEVVRE